GAATPEAKAMHEYVARPVYYVGVHLFYASLVWFAAWVLTSRVRGSATAKYWVWVATSLNFVLPLGAILDKSLATHLAWARPLGAIGEAGLRVADNATTVGAIWLVGAILMVSRLWLRIRADRQAAGTDPVVASSQSDSLVLGTPVRFVSAAAGPTVD